MISTTQPDSSVSQEMLAAQVQRRIAAHPEFASSDLELRIVDGRYVVVLGEALRARLGAVLTESAPKGSGGA